MIEAYRIGVNLVMDQTKVTGPLGAVLKAFEAIQQAQRATQAALNELASGTRAAAAATNRLAEAWRNVASAAQSAGGYARNAGAPSAAAPPSPANANTPSQQTNRGSVLFLGGPSGGALAATPAAAAVNQQLLLGNAGGGAVMPPLNYGGGLPAPLASGGISMTTAITAFSIIDRLVTGIAHLTEKAASFNDALVHLEQRGVSPRATQDLEDTVFKIAREVPGRSLSEITKDAGSLRAVLGESPGGDDLASVKAFLPDVEKTAAAISGSGHISSEAALHMLFRAIEMRGGTIDPETGKISPERFKKELDAVYKVLQTAGGIASERDILNLVQQGSVVAKTMPDPDDFWKMMIAPLVDQKGSRAGTALQAAGRQLLGGIMSKRTASEMERIGIIPPDSFAAHGAGYVELKPEAIEKLTEGMKGGLQSFIEKVIRPNLVSHGFVSEEQQNAEVFKIAGTDTFRRILSLFLSNADQVMKEGQLYDKVPPVVEALKMLNEKSIGFNITAMTTSVSNFFEVLAKANTGSIISLTKAIKGFFDFFAAGQEMKEQESRNPLHSTPSLNPLLGPDKKHWFWQGDAWSGDNDNSVAPPAAKDGTGKRSGDVYLDGKKVGMIVQDHMADQFSRPQSGPTGADMRVSPLMPGMATAFG